MVGVPLVLLVRTATGVLGVPGVLSVLGVLSAEVAVADAAGTIEAAFLASVGAVLEAVAGSGSILPTRDWVLLKELEDEAAALACGSSGGMRCSLSGGADSRAGVV